MVGVGSRARWSSTPVGGHIATVGVGCIQTAVGIGIQITVGAGPRFTMAGGTITPGAVGFGSQTRLGPRRGSVGDTRIRIAVGRRCLRERIVDQMDGASMETA